jgi:hypothetical protein
MSGLRTASVAVGCLLLFAAQTAVAQQVWRAVHTLVPGDLVRSDDVTAQTPSGRVQDVRRA